MSRNNLLLEWLELLVSNNVVSETAYINRYKGFYAELDFLNFYRNRRTTSTLYTGGYFLPTEKNASTLSSPIYFTISPDDVFSYASIYRIISTLECKKMFYIYYDKTIDISSWEKIDVLGIGQPIPVPSFSVSEYCQKTHTFKSTTIEYFFSFFPEASYRKKKEIKIEQKLYYDKLSSFLQSDLLQLYVSRLLFDGFIGFGRKKGSPSDIDIILEKDGKFSFVEIKEKDISKREPKGFGMDVNRIESLKSIMDKTMSNYLYAVREIDNQIDRKFLHWKCIGMNSFIKHANTTEIEGGSGMKFEGSSNPTRICPYKHFKLIE